MRCTLPSRTRCQACGRKREPAIDTVLRETIAVQQLAKRLRVPKSIRVALIDAIDHCFREMYAARRRTTKRSKAK
jgi:hypothetical protein